MARTEIGDELELRREHDNPADEDGISVHRAGGVQFGYLAREVARVLAPLLDLEGGPSITATLAVRPPDGADVGEFEHHDVVLAYIVLTPPVSRAV